MEPVGFVASVATLIQTANFVRRILSDYKKGGKDRDRLLAEVDSLKSVLDRLKADNENATRSGKQEPWLDIVEQLSRKDGTFEQIEEVVSEVKLKLERKQGLRGAIVHWTWPFVKEDVDRNVRQMQRLSHHISFVLEEASLKLSYAINQGVARVDKTTNRRELKAILEWLSSLYFLEQQNHGFRKAFPGTCEWFLTSPEYNAWKLKQHRVLYCSAIGGAGKTILASVAIDNLRMEMAGQDTAIFIMYCKHDRPDTHSVDKLAMTMLQQLIQLKACQIPPDLEELLERHYYINETRPSLDEVLKVINAHLPAFSAAFVLVDGLDEIMDEEARERIITFLLKLEGTPRLMFTSRPIDLIEKMFLSAVSESEIEEIGLADDDGGSDDSRDDGEANYRYDYDVSSEDTDEEDSSEELSDPDSLGRFFEKDSDMPEYAALITPNTPFSPFEDTPQDKNESCISCSRCGRTPDALQYHCYKCSALRSVVCVACYDLGTRCVNGDSSHDVYVRMRLSCLKIDVSARPRAIRRYVRGRTQESAVLMKYVNVKSGFADEVEDTVTRAAHKMFLLAQLHMDALSNPDLLKYSEVRNALDNLSVGLNDSYNNAMERTQGHGRSLLRLIAYAQRPLNIREVEHALALTPESDEILEDEIISAGTLISRCAGLVTLDENDEIVFSHYTIVGYFAERRSHLLENGHKYMAESCLNYFNLGEFQHGPVHGMDEASSEEITILDTAYDFINDSQRRSASVQAFWFSTDEFTAAWRSRSGGSPLQLAMYFKYQMLANRLLHDGTNADIQDAFGMTPLMWAAQAGNLEMMKTILHANVPLNAVNDEGQNALHIAILHCHEDVAIQLIDQGGMDVNAPVVGERGSRKVTPLMLAVNEEELMVVEKILARKDVLINLQDTGGQTAVHRIVDASNVRIMKVVVNAPSVDLEIRDDAGYPALTLASFQGNLSAVKTLLDAGADVNIRESPLNAEGNALMRAADQDAVYVVHELIKRGIDWMAKDSLNRNAVHSAAINGSYRSLAVLLDLPGIEINLQDFNGNTPIHDAAGLNFESPVLGLLLNKGARTDICNKRGKTPLDAARTSGTRKNVRILKEKYAEDFGMPKRSMTGMSMEEPTLPQAATQGDEAAVASMLSAFLDDKSIDLEERDDWLGRTPLQLAIDAGHLQIVKKLHQVEANINLQNNYGRTALHIATLHRYRMSIARYLLRNDADVKTKNK